MEPEVAGIETLLLEKHIEQAKFLSELILVGQSMWQLHILSSWYFLRSRNAFACLLCRCNMVFSLGRAASYKWTVEYICERVSNTYATLTRGS